ncbi:MAG TPA: type II secretion system protein GspL [Steroidobacteraceae bacterium]|nr:type II secretion system protein GspL [Steroidobacteraceae bacterium]
MATTEWLLLRLPAQEDDAPLHWAAADESGKLLSAPADEHDLAAMAAGRRVALLAPAADVSRFEVQLPAANEARLLQLAPFALEDLVSEDLEQLHFAVGVRDSASGLVPVAVVNRQRMAHWLARATALRLQPAAVFAESDLAPVMPGHVTMVLVDDQLLLRREGAPPLLMPADDPALALEMLLGDAAEVAGANLMIHAAPDEWARHAGPLELLRERVASFNVQLDAGGLLALYARSLGEARPINLLQGAFRPAQSRAAGWERWRGAALMLLALVVLHVGASWWQLHRLHGESAELDQSMAQLYARVFPGQRPGPDPHAQFVRRNNEINAGTAQKGEFLPLLAALAAAQQNAPATRLESLTFKPGMLQLQASAPTADGLEQFSEALRAGGYAVQILSGQSQGERYAGQISVKAGS